MVLKIRLKQRWIVSVLNTAARDSVEMPWQRKPPEPAGSAPRSAGMQKLRLVRG